MEKQFNANEFAKWLGFELKDIQLAIQIVQISDPDGAYTHLQDMGQEEAAEAVSAIYFDYGSVKEAKKAFMEDNEYFKDDTNINESLKSKTKTKRITLSELKKTVVNILKEELSKKNRMEKKPIVRNKKVSARSKTNPTIKRKIR
jgi:hypothetical protein